MKASARNPEQGMNWIRLSTRLAIYHRDGFCCVYCGTGGEELGQGLTLDHLLACDLGGDNDSSNLVTSCRSCNSAKSDRTMRGWFAYLSARGIDTTKLGRRIRRLSRTSIDRKAGLALAAARKAPRASTTPR